MSGEHLDPAEIVKHPEWIKQLNLIYVGLIGVGLIMVQAFLPMDSLTRAASVCVVAFSIAIPLLAALVMVNQLESERGRLTKSRMVGVARVVAQLSAAVGVVAGFWHGSHIAGICVIASGAIAVGVHSAGYVRLEPEPEPGPAGGDAPS